MVLALELGEPKSPTRCPDCGAENQVIYGFVYRDGDAYAVYHGMFSRAHRERGVSLRILVGDWSEGASPSQRISFGLEVFPGEDRYEFTLVGPDRSVWGESEIAGPMLTREESLRHPAKDEIFHCAEHIVYEDPRVRSFLEGEGQAA